MRREMAVMIVLFFTVTGAASGVWFAQAGQSAKPVTNADVISMTTAGLSESVIVSAVKQAEKTDFDLSPAGLIALKNAGVADGVIQAMQARARPTPSPMPQSGTAGGVKETGSESPPSEPCRVFITEEDPPSRMYIVVRKEVQAGKRFYGSHDDKLMAELAKQADKHGADAIIRFHEWRAPSAWSWASAKAGGMAVKWTTEGKAAVPLMKGQCWSSAGPVRK